MKAPNRAVTMVMILPSSEIWAAAAFKMKNAALELILCAMGVSNSADNQAMGVEHRQTTYANIESYSSSEMSVIGFFKTLPTVLTTMSILPKSFRTDWNNLSTFAALVRSPW